MNGNPFIVKKKKNVCFFHKFIYLFIWCLFSPLSLTRLKKLSDVDVLLTVKICSLDGIGLKYKRESLIPNLDSPFVQNAQLYSEIPSLFVTVELLTDGGEHVTAFSARTSSKCFISQCLWDEAIVFPVKYRDLPLGATVVFAVWDVLEPSRAAPIAVASLPLFGKSLRLKHGRKKIRLTETCCCCCNNNNNGLSSAVLDGLVGYEDPLLPDPDTEDSMRVRRLEKMTKRLTDTYWLNPFTTAKVMQMKSASERLGDDMMYLFVELPSFAAPVRFCETPRITEGLLGVVANTTTNTTTATAITATTTTTTTTATATVRSERSSVMRSPSTSPLSQEPSARILTSPFPPAVSVSDSTFVPTPPLSTHPSHHQHQQVASSTSLSLSSSLSSAAGSEPSSFSSPAASITGGGGGGGGRPAAPFVPSSGPVQIIGNDAFTNKTKSSYTMGGSTKSGSEGRKRGKQSANSNANNDSGGVFVLYNDPGLGCENPAEEMYTKLIKSSHQKKDMGVFEELKLSIDKVKLIDDILKYPPLRPLDHKDMELLWNYAPCLAKTPRALPQFLKSVQWDSPDDVKYALAMLRRWEPPAPEDVLILLSKLYPCEQVRKYAVDRLREAADDSFLATYLLQLVQALRHEADYDTHHLCDFLNERAAANPVLASSYYWYLKVAAESKKEQDKCYARVLESFMATKTKATSGGSNGTSSKIAGIAEGSAESPAKIVEGQERLLRDLQQAQARLKESGKPRPVQIKMLKEMVSPEGEFACLHGFPPTRLIVDPQYTITGIDPESLYIFKSNLMPLRVGFRTREEVENPAGGSSGPDKRHYNVIFKSGDDLRQDQLMVQMIALMNNLLRKENLDLKVLSYRVLATAEREGMVECVGNAESIDHIITTRKTLQAYLAEYNADASGPYGIREEVIDTYVRSCAGSSVITYLLGVGDRHLDNLMLTQDGHIFHIDFSYILGNDIKPRPSPMKICKEMIAAMGGTQSTHYTLFQQYCCEAYNILRMSATHIINLFQLMLDGGLTDLTLDSLRKLEGKFHLEMSDLEATKFMLNAIDVSANAAIPAMVDQIHRIAQYLKS